MLNPFIPGERRTTWIVPMVLLGWTLTASALGREAGWPQWRGPTRDGHVAGTNWPARLDDSHLQQQWTVPLGPSYAGPIIVGDRVFTTETVGRQFEVVTAWDRDHGQRLWRTQWEGSLEVPFFAKSNGDWIRSTPACDGERLYVAGMRDLLVCLDVGDGDEIWRVDFTRELGTPLPAFGFVCSPLVEEGSVFVQAGASVLRLGADDGRIVWRSLEGEGGMMGGAFSSPVIATLGGRRQLVVQTREELAGLELGTGQVLWRQPVKAFRGMNILTPVIREDLIFTSTYGGGTRAYRMVHDSAGFRVEEAWRHKAQGYMSTPVIVGRSLFHHLRSQRVMCLDWSTGEERWTSPRSFGKYWSLVAQGDRLLALDQSGELLLLDATPEAFRLIDSRRVSRAETWAHVAVVDHQVFIRSLEDLSAWRWEKPGTNDVHGITPTN